MKPIKIAIQKSGKLNYNSIQLLKNCGLNFENYEGVLLSVCNNFPLEILFLRDDDIPKYVQDGVVDLGVCGENVILEKTAKVTYFQRLGFGKCTLTIAVSKNNGIYNNLEDLNRKAIATAYPNILERFLKVYEINAQIVKINGSVEISPDLGISDAVCDLVSTGNTLKSNGLRPFVNVLESEAVLIGKYGIERNPKVQELLFRVKSVLNARETKYVVLNIQKKNISKITKLLPGLKSPTVIPLAEKGWVAVHSVINESDFWEKISKIKDAGAKGIAVMPMEKVVR